MKRSQKALLSGLALALVFSAASARAAGTWGALGGGLDGDWVRVLYTWEDKLVAAGKFTSAGGQPAHNVAVWDGGHWMALGEGWNVIEGITSHDGQLAVAGQRPDSTAFEIALWSGTEWATFVETQPNRNGLASYEGRLYQGEVRPYQPVGGYYSSALWEYDGMTWTQLRSWISYGQGSKVEVLRVLEGQLFMDIAPFGYVYSFDGVDFTDYYYTDVELGKGLAWAHGEFYAGGDSPGNGGVIRRWNGAWWEVVYVSQCADVETIIEFNDKLIMAGEFKSCASLPGPSVLSWDGSNWSAIGGPMNDCVWALAVYQGRLIAGGRFTEADSMPIPFIAEYLGPTTPVTIGKFRAHAAPGGVDLAWQITADEPFDGFSIYRSDDGGIERPLNAITLSSDTRAYTDHTAAPGGRYSYVLVATGGESGEIRSQRVDITVPLLGATLHQNIPNPFNPETTVRFTVATQGRVTISVYTPDGRRVRSLVDATYAPGEWSTTWDGTDDRGQRVASGVYYYRMRSGKIDTAKKMVLLK